MFFCSNQPLEDGESKQDHDFWVSERQGNVLGENTSFSQVPEPVWMISTGWMQESLPG
jgi:hypothetical protein